MEGNSKKLITFLMEHKGKDFDAIIKDEIEGIVGFSFMSYIKRAKIHIQAGRITVSEPNTGKYLCLPISGIKHTLLHIFSFLVIQNLCLMIFSTGISKMAKFESSLSSTFKNSVVQSNSGNFGLPVSQVVFQHNPLGLSMVLK
ncbi:hypothetical protein [Neobacillus ginsengisoli]|uniref:Uncharacterized protein n=1 Tax=Neobacillus ginsengisoli TaxID=904295 RepID=A0ABT9XRZ4_9BACI|nr:hypothetical protein [Neobacillus ginsengisoli]MDQ0198266.1 hypothetical protein [Neobacillus ginsengisoli]